MIDWLLKSLGFENPSFGDDFWPNFWSNIIAGAIFGALLSWVVSKTKRTNLEVALQIATGLHGNYTLRFMVLNNGNVSLQANEIYWHVYFDRELETSPEVGFTGVILRNKMYKYFNGPLALPCFSNSSANCFEIPVKLKQGCIDELQYFYSLSTSKGFFPRLSIWQMIKRNYELAPGNPEFVKAPLGLITKVSI